MRSLISYVRLVVPVWMALVAPCEAAADAVYPNRPIRIIVPFPGGGAMDVATRVVLNSASQALGQQFVVENKPGASGSIGTQQAAKSDADGYNLLMGAAVNTVINTFMYSRLGFELDKDFMPVAQFGNSLNVVYVHPSFPANDMRQLVDMVRKAPNRYLYASPGNGTTPHLMMEMLKTRLQLPVSHVPFKGSPGATTAVVGGELQIGVDAVGATMSLIRSGKLKALAVTGNRRFAGLPDVPTLEEAGMGVNVPSTYLGIYAPAGVAPAIVARLAGEVESSLKRPEVLKRLESLGVQPEYRGPSAFKARVDQDRALWGEAVKVSGAKVD